MQVDETIGGSRLSAEEWQKRQELMAKNNALLFYQEHKAKRLKKIKSKAYHRHLKKRAAKAMPADDEASQQVLLGHAPWTPSAEASPAQALLLCSAWSAVLRQPA